ncbi:peptidase inhibitor family I36 protein [Streptomyces candidus]|uniref:peptidase inhibitor family I36 protein n=1 Tax=Streptomyces candidus TaxID=67283 RepID=UPI001E494C14|nr:peptidase inhibitor family I36 protein [Streptomyces candidus]
MRTTALAATLAVTALLPQTAEPATAAEPAATGAAAPAPAGVQLGACAVGEFCLWHKPDFKGKRYAHELAGTEIESCVPLPPGADAQALANRTGRPVTTYQSAQCAETGEFDTYPGSGSWVPRSPYKVRAFKVWES